VRADRADLVKPPMLGNGMVTDTDLLALERASPFLRRCRRMHLL
jgi:hypothetical protein